MSSGYEGVACVDDAARALDLYCALWEATRLPWLRRWCDGLLDFILAMQGADGRWLNFILDWEGTPNLAGRTSMAGGDFWQSRAVLALARPPRSSTTSASSLPCAAACLTSSPPPKSPVTCAPSTSGPRWL